MSTFSIGLADPAMRDRLAQENYQAKTFVIKDKVSRKPTLDTLYYNQTEAVVEAVPADLSLDLVLEKYNEKNRFVLQEKFVEIWKPSEYDLIHIANAQLTIVAKLLADLRKRELGSKLKARLYDGIVDLMNDWRQGRMSDED
ncbi:hypothetical protein N0V86_000496 [Didymella sp. IMI 355093]|nr:hypothetical protein N0V86_000496 [Didymella sp. IMI 355093]